MVWRAVNTMSKTPDPDGPTVTQRVAFLVKAGTPWRFTGVESLSEVTVGIVEGFYYVDPDLIAYLAEEHDNEARVHVMFGENTTRRGLRMLQGNRITTLLEGEYSATYELEKMGLSDAVTVAGYTIEAFDDYTGFSPRNPKAVEYAGILSETITELKQSGRLQDILLQYGINTLGASEGVSARRVRPWPPLVGFRRVRLLVLAAPVVPGGEAPAHRSQQNQPGDDRWHHAQGVDRADDRRYGGDGGQFPGIAAGPGLPFGYFYHMDNPRD